MMSEDLQKVTLNLYAGDYTELMELYPDIGAAVIVRRIIRRFLEQVRAKGTASIEAGVEINI